MAQYQQGDAMATERLVRALSPALPRYLALRAPSRSEAEDLLQDTWLRIHRARHTYRQGEPLLPWIYAIARNTSLDGLRKRMRLSSHEVALEGTREAASAAPADSVRSQLDFTRLLAALPESQREVIWMLKVSGMSVEEVARATASTAGAVKQKAHRAYQKLRQLFAGPPARGAD
jgi:RNA polymerase sigma-70 factor (ECF subfamily)